MREYFMTDEFLVEALVSDWYVPLAREHGWDEMLRQLPGALNDLLPDLKRRLRYNRPRRKRLIELGMMLAVAWRDCPTEVQWESWTEGLELKLRRLGYPVGPGSTSPPRRGAGAARSRVSRGRAG